MQLDLATAEYIGAREQQQDLAAALPLASGALLVLADGLGGHESGADASRIVVTTFKEAGAAGRFRNPANRRQALREVLDLANARIAEGVDPAHGHRGMASTVVAAVVENRELRWVSVGDSHLYIWRQGRLHKLNEDHSQAGLMVRSGQYQQSDPEVQAVKSVLVSALTGRKLEIVDLPQANFRLEVGDVLILASDGLNTLSDAEIEDIVDGIREHGAIKLSTTLLESVRSRRLERQDNTTVVVARILEPARAVAAATPSRRPSSAHEPDLDDTSEDLTQRITTEVAPETSAKSVSGGLATGAAAAMAAEDVDAFPARTDAAGSAEPTAAPEAAPKEATSSEAPRAPGPRLRSERPAAPRVGGNRNRFDDDALPLGAAPADTAPDVVQTPLPAATRNRPLPSQSSARSRIARALVLLVALLLLASGVAIASLKPEWLSGIVPGFGDGRLAVPIPEPVPGASGEPDVRENAGPAPEQGKAAAPADPTATSVPPAAPNAPAELPQAVSPSPALGAAPSSAAPAAIEPSATASQPPTVATDTPVPSPAAPQPTATSTPPLVEPERPAARPGERQRSP